MSENLLNVDFLVILACALTAQLVRNHWAAFFRRKKRTKKTSDNKRRGVSYIFSVFFKML